MSDAPSVQDSVYQTLVGPIRIEVPSEKSANYALDRSLTRSRAILDVTRDPMTAEDIFRQTASIPMASLYHLLNSMVRLGWLRVYSVPNKGGRGNRTKVYTSAIVADPYPRTCPVCGVTVYPIENEARHRQSRDCL